MKNKSPLLFAYLLCLSIFVIGCTSTKLDRQLAETSLHYLIEENLTLDPPSKNYQYIFLRLYDPKYSDPLYIGNLLKAGIAITEVGETALSHASINTNLSDYYYGLTTGGKFKLDIESCTNIADQKFMGKCNPTTSTQITYALKVTKEEAAKIKKDLETYIVNPKLGYDTFQNFKIGFYEIGRKFFTPKKHRGLKKNYLPFVRKKDVKNFVCSTFISYVLINNVPSIAQWFESHHIDYNYIGVSDLAQIPGMVRIFSSTWENYTLAANEFAKSYPEFKQYLNN